MEIVETFDVKLSFEVRLNEETGEINTVCVKKSIDKTNFKATKQKKASKKEESSEPTLTLEPNKYYLNQAAVDLMQISAGDKLDIKYEKQGTKYIPVIGTDESFGTHSGCKLSKSMTVACRGSKNDELSKYGNEFLIIPHETKVGIFILQDKNANFTEEEDFDPFADIQDMIDNADVTEVDSSIFKL